MSSDLLQQLEQIKTQRRTARHKRFRSSRLDRHRAEIEALARADASWADIAIWLRTYKRVKVDRSTVGRALARWQPTPPTDP